MPDPAPQVSASGDTVVIDFGRERVRISEVAARRLTYDLDQVLTAHGPQRPMPSPEDDEDDDLPEEEEDEEDQGKEASSREGQFGEAPDEEEMGPDDEDDEEEFEDIRAQD